MAAPGELDLLQVVELEAVAQEQSTQLQQAALQTLAEVEELPQLKIQQAGALAALEALVWLSLDTHLLLQLVAALD